MNSYCLSPRFCNFHHCFIELPLHFSHNIFDHAVTLVEWNSGRVYLWALFLILPEADICRLDYGFSRSLGLLEQSKLFISFPQLYLPQCIRTDGYFIFLKPSRYIFPLDTFQVFITNSNSPVIVSTYLLKNFTDVHSCSSHLNFYPILHSPDSYPNYVSKYLFCFPNICISDSLGILLRPSAYSGKKPTKITLLISQVTHDLFSESKIIDAFKKLIAVLSKISIFPVRNIQEFLIDIEGITVFVVMQMDCLNKETHSFLYLSLLECIPIDVIIQSDLQTPKMTDRLHHHQCSRFPSNPQFFGYNHLKSHSKRILKSFLSPLNHINTNLTMLVTGENVASQNGTKSFVMFMLAIVSDLNFIMHIETLNCMSLLGKNLNIIIKSLTAIFGQESNSIIILYNFECLFPETFGEHRFNRHASTIYQFLFSITYRRRRFKNKLIFIATTKSKDFDLEPLICPQGKHLFQHRLVIKQPTYQDRLYILENNIQNYFPLSNYEIDCNLLISEFPNVHPRKYLKIILRSIQYSVLEGNRKTIQEILRTFFSYYASHNYLGLSNFLTKRLPYTVPLLDSVRKPIVDTLSLHLKFPRLISKLPLRNKVGILLYGMPGTGKTYFVDSLAKENSLNVLKIRGPEVLDKYIGASEDKIREIFALARASTPSLIFFDEFDSIARCRGSQHMGVLDRVVNQLLTELDGVQELDGVSIIATTCHPELIDTALLRPGRIGMHIKCNLPSLEERKNMIEYLMKESHIDTIQSNDVMAIAELTSGFSHADINSLIASYKHANLNSSLRRSPLTQDKFIVSQIGNLTIPHPSLSRSDREKYELMYLFFEKPCNSRYSRGMKITCA
ncbi:hypothetical protein LOD99_9137 [Oopsacas minuta]|uniref:AAA+ ATPase domain-containing protein n=1 Tax=Oopsacas minuta TaxID=111878 RepID=A0AAV7JDW4_9METZ|nr:hypothetical protein LOD99_9137 [Oopsacas minuta]